VGQPIRRCVQLIVGKLSPARSDGETFGRPRHLLLEALRDRLLDRFAGERNEALR
jgi:hypothetical protein